MDECSTPERTTATDIPESNSPCIKKAQLNIIEHLRNAICAENADLPAEHNESFKQFCEEIKQRFSIDLCDAEIEDMKKAVEELLNRLWNVNNNDVSPKPVLSVGRLVPCGSMAENTSNWKYIRAHKDEQCIEFDFLAVLNNEAMNDFQIREKCDGFLEVNPSKTAKEYLMSHNKDFVNTHLDVPRLDAKITNLYFGMYDSMTKVCECMRVKRKFASEDLWYYEKDMNKHNQFCDKCHVQTESGFVRLATKEEFERTEYLSCNLVMTWTSYARSLPVVNRNFSSSQRVVDHVYILVDLLPAIEVPVDVWHRYGSCGQHATQCDRMGPFFLVPKQCSQYHPTCWKVSTCMNEIRILRNTDFHHKCVFVIAKYIISIVFSFGKSYPKYHDINTYKLKTSFLHHCHDCFTQGNVQGCILAVLHHLASCLCRQSLPNFSIGCNILAPKKWADERLHKVTCVLLGDCLQSVCDTLTSLPLVSGQPLDPLKILSRLQVISRWYHEAWKTSIQSNGVFVVDKERLHEQMATML